MSGSVLGPGADQQLRQIARRILREEVGSSSLGGSGAFATGLNQYVMKTASVITARSGLTPGSGLASVQQRTTSGLVSFSTETTTIYSLSTGPIENMKRVQVSQDVFGTLWVERPKPKTNCIFLSTTGNEANINFSSTLSGWSGDTSDFRASGGVAQMRDAAIGVHNNSMYRTYSGLVPTRMIVEVDYLGIDIGQEAITGMGVSLGDDTTEDLFNADFTIRVLWNSTGGTPASIVTRAFGNVISNMASPPIINSGKLTIDLVDIGGGEARVCMYYWNLDEDEVLLASAEDTYSFSGTMYHGINYIQNNLAASTGWNDAMDNFKTHVFTT